jgi:hypothetical protein
MQEVVRNSNDSHTLYPNDYQQGCMHGLHARGDI